jgi:hypothetical protein
MNFPLLKPCGVFPRSLATAAAILRLSEADVWTLLVAGRLHPISRTRNGQLVFDGAALKSTAGTAGGTVGAPRPSIQCLAGF